MYIFLLFGPLLGFMLLVLLVYPPEELAETKRAALRGLVTALPIWIAARILGSLVTPLYGSFLLGFHEWAVRMLPYACLPAAAYLVFYRLSEPLRPGAKARRMTSFYAGAIAPLGLGEMVNIWGHPEPYDLFILPFLFAAIAVAMPRFVVEIEDSYGMRRIAVILGAAAATFAASLCPWLFLLRFWPLAWLLAAVLCLGAWAYARPSLLRRAPAPLAE
ncbi:MAG TPA: hypothetical protein VMV90_01095 [Rectinemataceae bacterium]|nr:hypothetical protein [Rectinemataceae bacterium]